MLAGSRLLIEWTFRTGLVSRLSLVNSRVRNVLNNCDYHLTAALNRLSQALPDWFYTQIVVFDPGFQYRSLGLDLSRNAAMNSLRCIVLVFEV